MAAETSPVNAPCVSAQDLVDRRYEYGFLSHVSLQADYQANFGIGTLVAHKNGFTEARVQPAEIGGMVFSRASASRSGEGRTGSGRSFRMSYWARAICESRRK